MSVFRSVAVVGAGLVGCGWTIVFARSGASVTVFDAEPAVRRSAKARIAAMLADMQTAGLISDPAALLDRITVRDTLDQALAGAEYVQESVFERVDVKAQVSTEIGHLIAESTIVGSSSSGIPASAFTESAPRRSRFLIAHPVIPPHLVPVVELVPAPWTDPGIIPWLRPRMEEAGQAVVEVKRELPGFVLNRLQGALLNEAWALYEEGYPSLEDIDVTVSQGLGLRWAFKGPFETIDLNAPGGIADYARRLGPLYHEIALSRTNPSGWSEPLIEAAAKERRAALPLDKLGERSRWRDDRLMALVNHLGKQKST